MILMPLELRAHATPWWGGVEFLLRDGHATCQQITLSFPDEGVAPNASFRLTIDQAQTLMDDLWTAGLRPTEGHGSAGAMAATQKHLDDMRRLVFDGTAHLI